MCDRHHNSSFINKSPAMKSFTGYCVSCALLRCQNLPVRSDLFLNHMVRDMKHTVEVMIPEAEIKARIAELGRQITERYKDSGSDMVLVGLLRGSFMFMADLCREVQVSHEVDFMTASSYGSGMSTTRDVKILKDLDEDIRGKDVLIVEDIIDSGIHCRKCVRFKPARTEVAGDLYAAGINRPAVK